MTRPAPIPRYCTQCGERFMAKYYYRRGQYWPRNECPDCKRLRDRRRYRVQKYLAMNGETA